MIVKAVTVRFDATYTGGPDALERDAALSAATIRARRRRTMRRRRTAALAVGFAGVLGAVAAIVAPL